VDLLTVMERALETLSQSKSPSVAGGVAVEDDVRVEAGEAEAPPISLEWQSSGPRIEATL